MDDRSFHPNQDVLHVVAAVIELDGESLLLAQTAGSPRTRHWEFPGGKVEEGETPQEALVREIKEELGLEIHVGPRLRVIEATAPPKAGSPPRRLSIAFYQCSVVRGCPTPWVHARVMILGRKELKRSHGRMRFHEADRQMLDHWLA